MRCIRVRACCVRAACLQLRAAAKRCRQLRQRLWHSSDGASSCARQPKANAKALDFSICPRKNASHRRVQGGCGFFYGAGRAVGKAEARGGPSTRARWPPRAPETRFAIFTFFSAARLAPTCSLPIRPHLVEMACNRYLHNPPPSGNHSHELWSTGEQMRPNGQGGKGGEPPFSTWRAFLPADLGSIWGRRYVRRWLRASFEHGRGSGGARERPGASLKPLEPPRARIPM